MSPHQGMEGWHQWLQRGKGCVIRDTWRQNEQTMPHIPLISMVTPSHIHGYTLSYPWLHPLIHGYTLSYPWLHPSHIHGYTPLISMVATLSYPWLHPSHTYEILSLLSGSIVCDPPNCHVPNGSPLPLHC